MSCGTVIKSDGVYFSIDCFASFETAAEITPAVPGNARLPRAENIAIKGINIPGLKVRPPKAKLEVKANNDIVIIRIFLGILKSPFSSVKLEIGGYKVLDPSKIIDCRVNSEGGYLFLSPSFVSLGSVSSFSDVSGSFAETAPVIAQRRASSVFIFIGLILERGI